LQIQNPRIVTTTISSIKQGDTVLIDGILKTVSANDIKQDPFLGQSLFGSTYFGNERYIQKALYYKWNTQSYH
jgi:hypothetical protein